MYVLTLARSTDYCRSRSQCDRFRSVRAGRIGIQEVHYIYAYML